MFPFDITGRPPKLDPLDDMILLAIDENRSLMEVGEEAGRSFSGIRKRMKNLESEGYLVYNPGRARARELTQKAKDYLTANGLKKVEVFP